MIRKILIACITTMRPLLGPAACRFPLSCTSYAQQQLSQHPLHRACWLITKRVLSCGPWPYLKKFTR